MVTDFFLLFFYFSNRSGSGIPDWKHGSLIGAQIEHAPDLGTVGLSRIGSNIRNPSEVNDNIGEVHAMPTVVPHSVMNKKASSTEESGGGKDQAKPIWLPGPVTPENETGWYSKKDPLYDKLWKDRNRVSVLFLFEFCGVVENICTFFFLTSIIFSSSSYSFLFLISPHNNFPLQVPTVVGCWTFMPKEQEKCAPIRRNKASKEARSAIAKNETGSKGDETQAKVELTNLDEVYLEQDWFYLSQDPDDHANTCLRQLPGTNRDSAEIAREAVANGARGGRRKSVRSICRCCLLLFVVVCCCC